MKKTRIRIAPLLLALCMTFTSVVLPVDASNPGGVEFINTYVNTGNQRQDIIGVAMTQLGYKEKDINDTKYGDWYGYPGQAWCAMFVAWCARQADISTDILRRNSWAHPNSFGIKYYHGSTYTPQPGDLFFKENFGHVGLVLYVEGDFFYCIEGNAKYHDYQVEDDPEVESYYVMTNKRLISDHYFGVPDYEGCDKDHTYVKSYESAHPHKSYYKCTTCGDKYYTGYTEVLPSCSKCFTCGCSSSKAGYYLVSSSSTAVKIRSSHSTSASYVGYATVGEAVYVHGINSSTGWAYIEYDGLRGHIQTKYLTRYCDIPASPTVTADKSEYIRGDSAKISWTAPANAEQYRLKVYRNGTLYQEKTMGLTRTITLSSLPQGSYEVQVIACNRSGVSDPGVLKFTVRNSYTVTYNARGGSGAPATQTQQIGKAVTLSKTVPVRSGYTFLGWTDAASGTFVVYEPGDTLSSDSNVTLYAVWKKNTAVLSTMTIEKMPSRTMFLLGETLDTTGLALRLVYSDGSGHIVTDGFTTAGFDSESYGTRTISVTRDGKTVTYDIQIVPYIPGDIDLNKTVDRDDVMQLLWHISFPDRFSIETPADFNSDGKVDRDDVMQLLWHISFPDRFSLDIIWPEEEETPTEPGTGDGGSEEETPTEPGTEDGGSEEETPTEPGTEDGGSEEETPTEPGTEDGGSEEETPTEPGTEDGGSEEETPTEPGTEDGGSEEETPTEPGTEDGGSEEETPTEPGTGDGGSEEETPTEPGTEEEGE